MLKLLECNHEKEKRSNKPLHQTEPTIFFSKNVQKIGK